MALTIVDQPYDWTLRGQKLVFRISSDQFNQEGFRYGVKVKNMTTLKEYEFLVDTSPSTTDLIFDLSSVVKMYNDDSTIDMHKTPTEIAWEEPQGGSWNKYRVYFSEWWLVGGVMTIGDELNPSGEEYTFMNGYYQPSNGYKPDPNSADPLDVNTSLSMESVDHRPYSDRVYDTHGWYNNQSGIAYDDTGKTMIPVYNTDYGVVFVPFNASLGKTIASIQINMYNGSTLLGTRPVPYTTSANIVGLGVYPMNLNDSSLPRVVTPAFHAVWTHYEIIFKTSANEVGCMKHIFYNAELFGQLDCRYDRVRLAWVNSRSGWDYFNFIKKSEKNNDFERKQYKRLLSKYDGTFDSWQRQLTDRQNIVMQTLTIQSDWLQESEFLFLRSLFASNQVEMIDTTGIASGTLGNRTPVSIVDTSYLERRERNGKKYNLTIKIKYSQDYWT